MNYEIPSVREVLQLSTQIEVPFERLSLLPVVKEGDLKAEEQRLRS